MLGSEWEVRSWATKGEFKFPFARVALVTPVVAAGPRTYADIAVTAALHVYPTPGSTPEESLMEVMRVKELLYRGFEVGITYDDRFVPPYRFVPVVRPVGALPAATYHYGVTCVDASGNETIISGDVPVVVPVTGCVELFWAPVNGARSYRVYRGPAVGNRTLLVEVTDSIYVDDGSLVPGLTPPPTPGLLTVAASSQKHRIPLYDYEAVPLDGPGALSFNRHPSDYVRVESCPVEHGVDPEDETQFRVIAQPRLAWRRTGGVFSAHKYVEEVRVNYDPVT